VHPEPPASAAVPGSRAEGARARVRRLLTGPGARRGLAMVHRWGPFAVTLAYLTVGVQTVVFTSAGLLRMPYLRFTIASIPGSVAWAFIWGTVGLGAAWAAVTLAAEQPWVLAGVLVLLLAVVAVLVLRRRSRRAAAAALTAEARAQRGEPVARCPVRATGRPRSVRVARGCEPRTLVRGARIRARLGSGG
jgi:multidrug transporter EmrE-like cation transporter